MYLIVTKKWYQLQWHIYNLTFFFTLKMVFENCALKYESMVADKSSTLNSHYACM